MDRAIIEGNRIMRERLLKLNKTMHREKLRSIQKSVDNDVPVTVLHPICKRSKQFKIEGNE